MESKNEVEGSDNLVSSNKLKSPNSGSDSNTMDSGFQDGGPPNVHADRPDRNRTDTFPPNVDGSQVCGDNSNMVHDVGTHNKNNEAYSKMNENGNPGLMQGYMGFPNQNRPGNIVNEQHGGPGNITTGSNDFQGPNGQFGQYGPQGNRGPYPPNSRPQNMPVGSAGSPGGGPVMGQNYHPGQQRFPMSGASIQQQGGPTPTLNQLLQSSGSSTRNQGNYGDQPTGYQRNAGDMNSNPGYTNPNGPQHSSWMNQPRGPMTPYHQHQMGGGPNQPYRGQGGQLMPGQRQIGPGNGGYSQQYNQYPASPHAQRYPMQGQGGSRMSSHPPGFTQQQGTGGQIGIQGTYGGSNNQQHGFPTAHSQAGPAFIAPGSQTQHSPTFMQQQPKRPQSNQSVSSQENLTRNPDDSNNRETNSSPALNARSSASSGVPPSSVQSQMPPPSPADSTGSRSNTPASVTGNPNSSGSPMPPPRPPSNQIDTPGRIQSPMPPGSMNRPAMQYPGQGIPIGQFPVNNPMMPGQQIYAGTQMGINRGPVPSQSYSNSYPPQNNTVNSMNTPYSSYNHSGGIPPTQSMPNSTQMPAMPAQAHSPKGAQAAAHAAMMAAANSASRPPVMKPPGGPSPQPVLPSTTASQVPQRGFPPNSQAPIATSTSHFCQSNEGQVNSGFSTPSPAPPGTPHSESGSAGPPSIKQPSTPGGQSTAPASPAASPCKVDENSQNSLMENTNSSLPGVESDSEFKPVLSMAASEAGEPSTRLTQSIMAPITTDAVTVSSSSNQIIIMKSEQSQIPIPHHNGQSMPLIPNFRMSARSPGPGNMPNMPPSMPNSPMPSPQLPPGMRPQLPNSHMDMSQRPIMPNAHPQNDMRAPLPNAQLPGDRMGFPAQSGMGSQAGMGMQCGPNIMMHPGMSTTMNDQAPVEKFRAKENISHPPLPGQQVPASPGGANLSALNDEFDNVSSPSWPGTPKPCYDGVNKLYDMGDEPDRKPFLDRLFAMMDEKGTPLTSIPTITKQPLDLYKMYASVKERGGCIEVSRGKRWRDICGCLSLNTSGSAGFALRKNYIKFVLPYECRYDRGNCDPAPVITQVESLSQKKDKKRENAAAAAAAQSQIVQPPPPAQVVGPSGGMSNPGFEGQGFEGGYMHPGQRPSHMPSPDMPGPPNTSIPPGTNMMMTRMNTDPQQNIPSHSQRMMGQMGPTGPNTTESVSVQDPFADQPTTQYSRPNQQFPQGNMQSMNNTFYDNRPAMSSNISYSTSQPSSFQGNMNRMTSPPDQMSSQYPRGMNQQDGPRNIVPEGVPSNQSPGPRAGPPFYQSQYNSRFGSPGNGQQPMPTQPSISSHMSSQPNATPRVPTSSGQDSQMFGNHFPQQTHGPVNHYKTNAPQGYQNQRPLQSGDQVYQSQQSMASSQSMYSKPSSVQPDIYSGSMSPQQKFSPAMDVRNIQTARTGSQQWPTMGMQPRPGHTGGQGYGNMPGSPSMQQWYDRIRGSPQRDRFPSKQPTKKSSANSQFQQRRDVVFPPDSVEATQPRLIKRKRLCAKDISPVDPWKVMMALKSGLLAESSWALDTLSILLFDDHTVTYFSLTHLPGLLEALLDHFRQCLKQIFNICQDLEIASQHKVEKDDEDEDLKLKPHFLEGKNENYTMISRQGKVVKIEEEAKDAFFLNDNKKWDTFTGFDSSRATWQIGHADMSTHVLTCFHKKNIYEVMTKKFYGNHYDVHAGKYSNDSNPVTNCDDCCDRSSHTSLDLNDTTTETNKESNPAGCLDKCATLCKEESVYKEESVINEIVDPPILVKKENDTKSENNCESEHGCSKSEKSETSANSGNNVKLEPHLEHEKVNSKGGIDPEMEQRILNKLKRKLSSHNEIETEAYHRDQPPLYLISESQEELSKRCVCISNILRGFSFIPGNDYEMSRHHGLMKVLSCLLMLQHLHPIRKIAHRPFDREEVSCENSDDYVEDNREEWWWDTLDALRENTLVILANIAGQMNMTDYPEEICFPVLDGMLHWATCPASCAQDPLPTMSLNSVLSPQRLVLETMCKLCVHEENVDLILATPPFPRIVKLIASLVKHLSNSKEQVMREFSIVLLSSLVQGDSCAARAVALQPPCISLFLDFLETAERQAMLVAKSQGLNMLRENPEMMGTSLDMLRRAATTLKYLAMVPENHSLFLHHEQRLLDLVTSQILDQQVAAILSNVLYHCSSVLT